MNETEIKDRPVDDDVIELDPTDFKDEVEENSSEEETSQPTNEEVSIPTETKEEEKELDFTPLLEQLSKDIKFMDKEVKIASIDEGKTLIQKGLNHDRLQEKISNMEKDMEALDQEAKENGMTRQEFIKALEESRKQQIKQQEEAELNEMIESGVAENIARKVIETNRIAKELEREKADMREQKRLADEKAKKDAEDEKFINMFPDVDIKTIPSEVFKEAEEIGLIASYSKYQSIQLKKELDLLKKNQENETTSPVKGTTEHGGVEVVRKDPFEMGMDAE